MSRLATTFGRVSSFIREERPLTDEELFAVAPSIFAEDKHDSRSMRYTYIPTIQVIQGLKKEGFLPFMAVQSKTRIEGKQDFTKHMIRLRHANQIVAPEANEIILINSHDGTSSYQMLAGMFRFVCQNGMVAGDTVDEIRIPHRGDIVDNVIEAAYTIVDEFDAVNEARDIMRSIELSPAESELLATASLALKYDEDKAPIASRQLLIPKRYNDNKTDLWSRFNVIQENLTRGGQRGWTQDGKRTRTRPIQSIDNNVKVNKALWILADGMSKLKQGVAV